MVGRVILLLIFGYFAILGLLQVVAILAQLFWMGQPPEGELYFRAPENPDRTEGSLSYYCPKLRRDEAAQRILCVALPQNAEAREIALRYCGDHGIKAVDLLLAAESIIMETSEMKAGPQHDAAEDGKAERDD